MNRLHFHHFMIALGIVWAVAVVVLSICAIYADDAHEEEL